ncbi:hypothetical protein BBW65_07305 [Helicobacter enhydrae]|uniref:CvpA family protein n=1 Tax=Helicobacter enhydrae TaxID=222136 RepID=A0A1B1U747_9HELI|nr:CvpA family protein [Helicobacter enhydrae]ANV98614.1 hypothetical protein BBW65_07305 [Helicobacter enhydrae]
MENFGYIDLILLGISVFYMYYGYKIGGIQSLCNLIGWLLGIFIASTFAHEAGNLFAQQVFDLRSTTANTLVGFILLLIVSILITKVISLILKHLLKIVLPSVLDHILGAIFETLKALTLISVALFFAFNLNFMTKAKAHFYQHSKIFPAMERFATLIINSKLIAQAPEHIQKAQETLKEVGNQIKEQGEVIIQDKQEQNTQESLQEQSNQATPSTKEQSDVQ